MMTVRDALRILEAKHSSEDPIWTPAEFPHCETTPSAFCAKLPADAAATDFDVVFYGIPAGDTVVRQLIGTLRDMADERRGKSHAATLWTAAKARKPPPQDHLHEALAKSGLDFPENLSALGRIRQLVKAYLVAQHQVRQLETDLKAARLVGAERQQLAKYLQTSHGKDLLKTRDMDATGIWAVYGEDPNCDLGGNHNPPLLKTYRGKLGNVLQKAVVLPGFWQWGAGGTIKKVEQEEVEDV